MKTSTIVGLVLILAGVLALVFPKISYTNREAVLDVGPLKATAETQKTIPISPVIGGAAIAAGFIVLLVGSKKSV